MMIELKNIDVTFGQNSVLKNLSATIAPGDFITIVGPNGAGKSTLFDVIAGKKLPQRGCITIDGKEITNVGMIDRAHFIARLFQNPRLNTVDTMTVAENIALATFKGRRSSLRSAMRAFPHDLVESVLRPLNGDINNLLKKTMGSLSGGQRQMIALVMATLCPPKILLLDEPTAALDPQSAAKVISFMTSFIQIHEITALFITHDERLALSLGNKLWFLKDGNIQRTWGLEKKDIKPECFIEN